MSESSLRAFPLTANQSVTWRLKRGGGNLSMMQTWSRNSALFGFVAILALSSWGKFWAFNNHQLWHLHWSCAAFWRCFFFFFLRFNSPVPAGFFSCSYNLHSLIPNLLYTPSVCSLFILLGTLDVVEKSVFYLHWYLMMYLWPFCWCGLGLVYRKPGGQNLIVSKC